MGIFDGLFGSAPKPPNPYKVAEAQTKTNVDTAREQARLNAVNRYGPGGSVEFGFDPITGAPNSQTIQLSPEQQALYNAQTGTQTGISEATLRALGMIPQGPFDPSGIDTGNIAQSSFDRQMALLRPEFDRAASDMELSFSDRGIPIGSEIFTNESDRFDEARNNAMFAAARQADLDATGEAQRQFGNLLTEYNLPLSQVAALSGLARPADAPQFAPQAQTGIANTDVAGNIWNSYKAQVDAANAANQNLFGAASTALMFL